MIPQVALGDLIVCTEIPAGNVIYSVSDKIRGLIQQVQKSESCGTALWKLPGLLPRSPDHTASQILLWISKLIMEVNAVSYRATNTFIDLGLVVSSKFKTLNWSFKKL